MFEPQLQVRGVAEAVAVPHGRRCSQELGQLGTVTAGEEPWRGENEAEGESQRYLQQTKQVRTEDSGQRAPRSLIYPSIQCH